MVASYYKPNGSFHCLTLLLSLVNASLFNTSGPRKSKTFIIAILNPLGFQRLLHISTYPLIWNRKVKVGVQKFPVSVFVVFSYLGIIAGICRVLQPSNFPIHAPFTKNW